MNIFRLSISTLFHKPANAILSVLLFSIGIGIIIFLLQVQSVIDQRFYKNISDIDMVVGAKGSPVQLILSSVFHADTPTGNIKLEEAEKLNRHPLVKTTIPLAFGDNFNGYRIVGTNEDYPKLYSASLEIGYWFDTSKEATIGSDVAIKTGLQIGDEFTGIHGFMSQGHHHDEFKYTVVGIMKPTKTIIDEVILTPIQSVWDVHGGHECTDTCSHEHTEPDKEITALLVIYKNPMAAVQLPSFINQTTSMQSAVPAFEMNRLMSMLGIGFDFLKILAWIIVIISAINILMHLLNTLNQNIYEIALLRVMGASRIKSLLLLIYQGIILAFLGWIGGIVLSRLIWMMMSLFDLRGILNPPNFSANEFLILLVVTIIGIFSAIIPAVKAYSTNIHHILSSAQ